MKVFRWVLRSILDCFQDKTTLRQNIKFIIWAVIQNLNFHHPDKI